MAASLNSDSVMWVVGGTNGTNVAGATTTLPVAVTVVGSGSPTPTTAPLGAPLYIDTDTNDLFVWGGTAWLGPYSTAT
jgi:hypothetical protein